MHAAKQIFAWGLHVHAYQRNWKYLYRFISVVIEVRGYFHGIDIFEFNFEIDWRFPRMEKLYNEALIKTWLLLSGSAIHHSKSSKPKYWSQRWLVKKPSGAHLIAPRTKFPHWFNLDVLWCTLNVHTNIAVAHIIDIITIYLHQNDLHSIMILCRILCLNSSI